jgi:hypothetical protein
MHFIQLYFQRYGAHNCLYLSMIFVKQIFKFFFTYLFGSYSIKDFEHIILRSHCFCTASTKRKKERIEQFLEKMWGPPTTSVKLLKQQGKILLGGGTKTSTNKYL